MLLTVDVRKAHDTGIGTYIRQVVPRVLRGWPAGQAQVVVGALDREDQHHYLDASTTRVQVRARPFGVAEQLTLRRFASAQQLLWATTLAHPLYTTGRLVCTVHDLAQLALPRELGGTRQRRLLAWPFFDSMRRCAQHLLHVSAFTAAEFEQCVGRPRGLQTVTPLGVEPGAFAAPPRPSARPVPGPYFLMVGNLRPHKNLALVLEALERAGPDLPHRVLLVGPDQSPSTLPSLRRRHGAVVDRLVLGGQLDQAALAAALHHAEALLFPSHYEGFGLPVLEAMAAGCPVLVARNGVSPGIAGHLALSFDPRDAAELARAMMAQATMEAPVRSRQVREAMERAAAATWDRTAELTIEALRAAAAVRR